MFQEFLEIKKICSIFKYKNICNLYMKLSYLEIIKQVSDSS